MPQLIFTTAPGYMVYIILNKAKQTSVGISGKENVLFEEQNKKSVKIIYFEKIIDISKTVRRKKYQDKSDEKKRLRLVRRKNPEMLYLLFAGCKYLKLQ